jgi:hypothetical protein
VDREIIERVAIDCAAGELNQDIQALFNTYLAQNGQASRWAEDMLAVYETTEAAIDAKTRAVCTGCVAPVAKSRLVLPLRHQRIEHWPARRVAGWAAVLIFAAFIGAVIGRWSKPPVLPDRPASVAFGPTLRPGAVRPILTVKWPSYQLQDMGGSFWLTKAMAMLHGKPDMINKDYAKGPTLWEKYRQFIKEKRYE